MNLSIKEFGLFVMELSKSREDSFWVKEKTESRAWNKGQEGTIEYGKWKEMIYFGLKNTWGQE
jgi:hypothetical protein